MARNEQDPILAAELSEALKASEDLTVGSDIFLKHLPEDNTEASLKSLSEYSSRYVAATVTALGNVAGENLASNKDAEKVTATFGMSHLGSTASTAFREKTITIPSPVKGEAPSQRVETGVVRTSVDFKGGSNSSMLKDAKKTAQELISKALG